MSSSSGFTLSYMSRKATSLAKDAEDKRNSNREKAMLIFAFQLLIEKGYLDTATSLSSECSLNLEEFAICDNIDLRSIFVEFEQYYHLRYQRYPQYFKKATLSASEALLNQMKVQHELTKTNKKNSTKKGISNLNPISGGHEKTLEMEEFNGNVKSTKSKIEIHGHGPSSQPAIQLQEFYNEQDSTNKLIKPISNLEFPNEDIRSFAEMIQREIVVQDLNTKWKDVIGLEDAKLVLEQTMNYTKEFVDFFGTGLNPWKGLLLYGPPGVGKTLFAKAVATECKTTFFNISSSSLISKWRGDSEKIVKTLFNLARYHAPSTLFFDEFEALGSKRDGTGNDSDAARRFKSELLQQMDGLLSSSTEKQLPIFILAATNLPWELDPAVLRRFEKRIYTPMPNSHDRIKILKLYFEKTARSVIESSGGKNVLACQLDFEQLSIVTEDFSASDLQQIVKDTIIHKFRDCYKQQQRIRQLLIRTEDLLNTIEKFQPTVTQSLLNKYKNWTTNNVQGLI